MNTHLYPWLGLALLVRAVAGIWAWALLSTAPVPVAAKAHGKPQAAPVAWRPLFPEVGLVVAAWGLLVALSRSLWGRRIEIGGGAAGTAVGGGVSAFVKGVVTTLGAVLEALAIVAGVVVAVMVVGLILVGLGSGGHHRRY